MRCLKLMNLPWEKISSLLGRCLFLGSFDTPPRVRCEIYRAYNLSLGDRGKGAATPKNELFWQVLFPKSKMTSIFSVFFEK